MKSYKVSSQKAPEPLNKSTYKKNETKDKDTSGINIASVDKYLEENVNLDKERNPKEIAEQSILESPAKHYINEANQQQADSDSDSDSDSGYSSSGSEETEQYSQKTIPKTPPREIHIKSQSITLINENLSEIYDESLKATQVNELMTILNKFVDTLYNDYHKDRSQPFVMSDAAKQNIYEAFTSICGKYTSLIANDNLTLKKEIKKTFSTKNKIKIQLAFSVLSIFENKAAVENIVKNPYYADVQEKSYLNFKNVARRGQVINSFLDVESTKFAIDSMNRASDLEFNQTKELIKELYLSNKTPKQLEQVDVYELTDKITKDIQENDFFKKKNKNYTSDDIHTVVEDCLMNLLKLD